MQIILIKQNDFLELSTAITYDYNSRDRLARTVLPDGHQLINEYTGDYLTKTYHKTAANVVLPELTQTFDYDARGNRSKLWDAKNQLTQVDYDDRGRVIAITNPLNEATHYTYTDDNLTQIEVGRVGTTEGQLTRLNYTADNRLESIDRKDDAGVWQRLVTYSYDSDGNRLTSQDAESRITQFAYDKLGRLEKITDPLLKDTQFEYGAAGNRTAVIDALNRRTEYVYDDLNRLTQVTEQGASPVQVTQFGYDAVGNLLTVTDPKNQTTTYTYDALSRLTHVAQPLTQTVEHVYDTRDRIDYTLNARGQRIDYDYEAWGPVKQIQYYAHNNDPLPTPDKTVSYSYDLNGNLTGANDDSIQAGALYSLTYDALNRPDVTTASYLPTAVTLDNDYDRYGNRDSLALNDGATHSHSYPYNKLNRLSSATLPGSQTFSFDYYATDELKQLTYPNGIVADYQYATNGPVKQIKYTATAGPLEQFDYSFDDVLNVDTQTDGDGLHDYSYDGVNRLTTALHPAPSGLANESYSYDPVGNREDPADSALYNYDSNNRIVKSPAVPAYSFDNDGNMTQRAAGEVLTYDHQNRLSGYTNGTTTTGYAYDPFGRRIKKTVGTTTTWYVWDGSQLIGEYNQTGTRIKRYAYLPGQYAPVQMAEGGSVYTVHSDHLQTPRVVTDSAQGVVWRGVMESFGKVTVAAGSTVELNVRFAGQYFDQETGFHYNYFRDYDPKTGRYLEADPIGQYGGINLYLYAYSNPQKYIDPFGLDSMADMARGLTGMNPANFPRSPIEAQAIQSIPLLPNQNVLGLYGDAWLDFMLLASLPEAGTVAGACGNFALGNQRLQKTLCALGIGAAMCRGEVLDDLLRDVVRRDQISRQSELVRQQTTHVPR
jgi:RHS repeat-associated protein